MIQPAGHTPPSAGTPAPHAPRRLRWLALGTTLLFLLLIARHWHPVYRFTAFLQMSVENDHPRISAIRELPIYLHPGTGSYDGQFYAQIACDPAIISAELPAAIDNPAYRARRILAPALAWLLAAGQPAWIVHTYSILNVIAWLALAAIAWRLLRVADLRTFVAWAGLLFSAGALHSVRFALTDLVALAFFAAGFLALESRRTALATGLLALGGLGRDTCLTAAPALWNGPWRSPRAWLRNALLSSAMVAPFALWLIYLQFRFPDVNPNPAVITAPGLGLLEKLQATFAALGSTNDPFLSWSTLLAVIAILAQTAYLLARPKPQDPWWRASIPCIALMLLLNHEVWEGDPGAITRVLLPLQLIFNVLASRQRAPLIILLAGNLSLFSGLAPYRATSTDLRELGHGHIADAAIIAHTTDGWYPVEKSRSQSRTWSQATSRLELKAWPGTTHTTAALSFKLRAYSTCTVTIRQHDRVLWQGRLNTEKKPIVLKGVLIEQGRASIDFSSDSPAHPEGPSPSARQLAFALYDLSVSADH
jgi:hypothetical protein